MPRHARTASVLAVAASALVFTASSSAATLYVAPSGTVKAAGTKRAPFDTISDALSSSQAGDQIVVEPGSYPTIIDYKAHPGLVNIVGVGTPGPTVAGAHLYGAENVHLSNFSFTAGVKVSGSPTLHYNQPATNISVTNSTITTGVVGLWTGGDDCIVIRGGSHNVSFTNDYMHQCGSGVGSVPTDQSSTNITFRDDTFSGFPSDGIDMGAWSNVVIDHTIITGTADPVRTIHNDAIQFYGNDHNVQITNDVISNSQDQLMLIADAAGMPNTNVLIQNDLLYGAGGWAIQTGGVLGEAFIGNTIWNNKLGGLLLRASGANGTVPHDTIVENNIIEKFGETDGATPGVYANNLISNVKFSGGVNNLYGVDPEFVDATDNDYRLLPGSPAASAGANALDRTDIEGVTRSAPSMGALQIGDPAMSLAVTNGLSVFDRVAPAATVVPSPTVHRTQRVHHRAHKKARRTAKARHHRHHHATTHRAR